MSDRRALVGLHDVRVAPAGASKGCEVIAGGGLERKAFVEAAEAGLANFEMHPALGCWVAGEPGTTIGAVQDGVPGLCLEEDGNRYGSRW